jgi:hypothetical protein
LWEKRLMDDQMSRKATYFSRIARQITVEVAGPIKLTMVAKVIE